MQFLAGFFVGQPFHILAVGLVGMILYGVFTFHGALRRPRTRPLLMASIGWILYALWEWLVVVFTPEANIRVDLMVIWPLLVLLSAYGALRLWR